MKKKDIIQLVKKLVKEDAYGSATLTTQGAPRTRAVAPAGKDEYTGRVEYPYTVGAKTKNGMMENQGSLSSDMLNYADQYHMELVDTMKGVSTHPDKRTGGFKIVFPHYNGPDYTGAMFGRDVSDKIEKSKAAAKAAAQKTVSKFQDQIEDYEITDKSRGGVHGSIHLFIMPSSLGNDYTAPKGGTQSSQFEEIDEAPMFRTGIKQDMAPEGMAERIKSVFNKVNGAQDPVKTPEWHKNRFKNKYGISFPENLKGINKEQALAMNKYANDMNIRETTIVSKMTDLSTAADIAKASGTTKDAVLAAIAAAKKTGDEVTVAEIDKMEEDHMDNEGRHAKMQLKKAAEYSIKLARMMDDMTQLPSWIQSKITKASDYISSVYHYLDYEMTSGQDNLMENVDKYNKRALLMEGAMKKFFEMFDKGKTDEEIVQDYVRKGTTVPEQFVSKARKQYEGLKKMKLELEISEKEFRNSSEKMVNNAEGGMEPGMEEKKLSSKLYNEEEVDEVSYDSSNLENPKAADISKDGDISDYELKRGKAIEKAIDKQKK